MVLFPLDSVIQRLKNRGQVDKTGGVFFTDYRGTSLRAAWSVRFERGVCHKESKNKPLKSIRDQLSELSVLERCPCLLDWHFASILDQGVLPYGESKTK